MGAGPVIAKVISGGQTGADRAGLDVARALGIPTGGFIPKGFRTEVGEDATLAEYGLTWIAPDGSEILQYADRTTLNVDTSNITLWFGRPNSPGYYITHRAANRHTANRFVRPTDEFLARLQTGPATWVVNVAGNRESRNPGMYQRVYDRLMAAWAK